MNPPPHLSNSVAPLQKMIPKKIKISRTVMNVKHPMFSAPMENPAKYLIQEKLMSKHRYLIKHSSRSQLGR